MAKENRIKKCIFDERDFIVGFFKNTNVMFLWDTSKVSNDPFEVVLVPDLSEDLAKKFESV